MLKKVYTLIISVSCFVAISNAQCTGGALQGALVPTLAWQTVASHVGKYFNFAATAGSIYSFSFCSCDGGACTVPLNLTVDSVNATVAVQGNTTFYYWSAYNTAYCVGANSLPQVTWRCMKTGTYQIVITAAGCALTPTTACTMAYIMYTPSLCYTVAAMAHAPDAYNAGTVPVGAGVDDGTCKTIPIGFNFCYNGTIYDSCVITTNGNLIFSKDGCDYYGESQANAFPSASYTTQSLPFSNALYTPFATCPGVNFPWQDVYNPAGGTIKWKLYGVAPNRHLTVAYDHVPLFLCNNLHNTSEVQIFETTNIIQIQTDSIPICASWTPGGQGVMGLTDVSGFAAVVPPGRNHTNWATGLEAWKFTPSCCPVLPVILTDFSCAAAPKGTMIYWSTASEINNRFYTLQRSLDGITFTTINQQPGAGNSDGAKNYTFLDTNTIAGVNYYRLQQTDFDGKTTDFNIIACSSGKLTAGNMFPNPATESFTVTVGPADQVQTLAMYDLVGRCVHTEQYEACSSFKNHVVNVPNLKGVFFVEITGGEQSVVRKIVLK
jgi:hypothetical protein